MITLATWAFAFVLASPQGGLQALIDAAPPGATVEIPSGVWQGPLVIRNTMHLRGRGVTIDGGGIGTVAYITAPDVTLEGLTIQNSGREASGTTPDACIRVAKSASDAIVRGNTVRGCHFGIWIHETTGASIVDNRIEGDEVLHTSLRGNGIQLFNGSKLRVEGNRISGGRDGIYVSTTQDSVISGNHMSRTRYGIHYMFSWRNKINANTLDDNQAGIALMQSRQLEVDGNVATRNHRQGIILRDILQSRIKNNRLEENAEGLFFYGSTDNELSHNHMARNEIGLKIWGGSVGNRVHANQFIGNRRQVFYVGSKDLDWGVRETGNYWSDYLGWDQGGDGIGDRPYRAESFMSRLLYKYPAAVLLLRSPSLELLAHMEQRLPLLQTPTIIDHQPVLAEGAL